jgi:antitoxin component of RelBE/YafQ-DinJ toxin-antitoxin module
MTTETRLTIRIDPELKAKAQEKAKAEDLTLSQVVRRYLMAYVGEGSEPEEGPPRQN